MSEMGRPEGGSPEPQRSREREFEALLRTRAVAVIVSHNGIMETFNDAAEAMFGYPAAEAIGNPLDLLVPEPVRSEHAAHLRRYLQGDEAYLHGSVLEAQGQRRNGEVFPIELILSEIPSASGRRIVACIQDLSGRRAVQGRLRTLSSAVEQSTSTIVITDREGRITYVNPAFTRVTGYTFEEARQGTPRILKSGLHPAELYDGLWKTISSGSPWRGMLCNRKKSGELYWEAASISPVRDDTGAITHYVGVKDDVTENKRQEQRLRDLALVAEETENVVVITDAGGRVEWVNPSFTRVTGFAGVEVVGKDYQGFLRDPDGDPSAPRWTPGTSDAARAFRAELLHVTRSGDPVWLDANIQPITGDRGEITKYISVASDVTDRRKVTEELRRAKEAADAASRTKSEFLANMTHEIRTPLNVVLGFASIALTADPDPRLRDYLTKIRVAGESLLRVVDDVLDFSKIEAGKLRTERVAFSLGPVVDTVASLITPKAYGKGLQFLFLQPDADLRLVGDPTRLGQVLINLLDNAVKFTAEGEVELHVEVESRAQDRIGLRFTVRDTGIGMTGEEMSMLFQPFTQADSSMKRRFGGTGLGLSITKRLVEMMDGRIAVQSEPSKGTTFTFTAWFGSDGERSAAAASPTVGARDTAASEAASGFEYRAVLAGARILLVEDNEVNAEVASTLLRSAGVVVYTATNGRAAVERAALATPPFDLILMDIQMPGMDGYEAAQLIRSMTRLADVPIVALTAHAMVQQRERALAGGMDDHIGKPIDPRVLFETVARNLKGRRAT